MIKRFVAFGPGYCGDYDTKEEAEAVVRLNGFGGIYELLLSFDAGKPSIFVDIESA